MKRRKFLQTSAGTLVVSFSLPLSLIARGQEATPVAKVEAIDAWLEIDNEGKATVFTGKVELGTGVETALSQLLADELDLPFDHVRLVMGDTERCPAQFPTVGSLTIYRAGPQLRQAAAEARAVLVEMAATQWDVPTADLQVDNGVVSAADGRAIGYGKLMGAKRFDRNFSGNAVTKPVAEFKIVGKSIGRVDLPAKAYGTHAYVHNLRIPGMLHGAVVRPAVHGAAPVRVDGAALKTLPGNPTLVTKGNFIGVVAESEHFAAQAAAALRVDWGPAPALPQHEEIPDLHRASAAIDSTLVDRGTIEATSHDASGVVSARYYAPYQLHASIGPSCAVADVKPDRATLWSATQSSFFLRDSIAPILQLPKDKVRLIWMEGSGCYGHNGADDCTADAALLSQQVGKPVRVQYSRRDENLWEPKGLAMCMEARGNVNPTGRMHSWDYQVWSPNHISARPFAPGNLLAGLETGHAQREIQAGADRNATHAYDIPNYRAALHLLKSNPLRCSSFRGLGSPQNAFANESFVDELASAAGADPLAFRLDHLDDDRALAVLEEVARISKWEKHAGSHDASAPRCRPRRCLCPIRQLQRLCCDGHPGQCRARIGQGSSRARMGCPRLRPDRQSGWRT